MREEYDSCGYSSMLFGITPAHAGRIICDAVSSAFHQDHPRACGKNFYIDEVYPGDTGSPPRMREEFGGSGASTPVPGITPAHAGRMYFR